MSELLVCRGLPASGKTSFARQLVDSRPAGSIIRLNRDDLRAMCLPSGYGEPDYRPEKLITQIQHSQITALLADGVDVIVDDTNMRARTVRTLAEFAVRAGAEWRCVDEFLAVPVEECIRRDTAREKSVGEEVIRRMWRKYLSHGQKLPVPVVDTAAVTGKPYVPPADGIPAVLVDLDGTVALHDGIRSPYDTSLYHLDRPNTSVIEAVRQELDCGNAIVFCSGRSSEFRDVTEAWIDEHVLPRSAGWQLFMRPAGDLRNDAIVKLELFDQNICDRFDVRRAYDDRDRVVSAYRSIGLTVLQCAPGNF